MHGNLLILAAIAGSVALMPKPASSSPAAPTTAEGVYSEAQATTGAALYATHCAMCHGRKLEGTYEIPPLKERFLGNWGHAPLGQLVDYVSRAMPQFAPGSLSADQNVAIVAYLLQENGMPAGPRAMAVETGALDAIVIEPKRRKNP